MFITPSFKKSLIVEHEFFLGKWFPTGGIFGQGKDFKLTTELSEKVQYSRNQAIKNGLNEAILLMRMNEALILRQNSVPFK